MPIIKLIVDGGSMKPGPAIAQQLGPMGINIGKVIDEVNKSTTGFKGVKVPIEIDANPKTKTFSVKVFSPPVAELIKKELGLESGSGMAAKTKVGNISIEQIISISKTKMPNMLAKDLKAAVTMVVGSCVSLGVLVDSKDPKDVEKEIAKGVYDKEIKQEKTEVDPEKKKKLSEFFFALKNKQEKEAKALEEAKAKEEAAKAEAAAAAGTPAAATAAPAAAAKTAAAPEAKKEEKPAKKK